MVYLFVVGVTCTLMLCQHVESRLPPLQNMEYRGKIVKTADDPTTTNVTKMTTLHDDQTDVTLKITDDQENVLETDSLPFGMDIKLKVESLNKNKTFALVPFWCQLISVRSNRKYPILQNGCGDGIMISKTAGFVIRNGTGFSPVFRAFDFSNDNRIKFSCNYIVKKYADYDNSCNNSSTILKDNGGHSTHGKGNLRNRVKGGNSYSNAVKSVETRVIGLRFPQQYQSVNGRNIASENKRNDSSSYVEVSNDPLHLRRLIFILAFLGFYVFILSIFISIQIERNKIEVMMK